MCTCLGGAVVGSSAHDWDPAVLLLVSSERLRRAAARATLRRERQWTRGTACDWRRASGLDQRAPSFRELTAYRHWVYMDGIRFVLPARCSYLQSANGHVCVAPLPRMGAGRHVLELTTTLSRGSDVLESAKSAPLVVIVAGAPQTGFENAADVGAPLEPVDHAPLSEAGYGYEPVATGLRCPLPSRRCRTATSSSASAPAQSRSPAPITRRQGLRSTSASCAMWPAAKSPCTASRCTRPSARMPSCMSCTRRPGRGRIGHPHCTIPPRRWPARRASGPAQSITGASRGPRRRDRLRRGRQVALAADDGGIAAGRSDPAVLAGKVLRLNEDGSAGSDNPHASPVIFAGLQTRGARMVRRRCGRVGYGRNITGGAGRSLAKVPGIRARLGRCLECVHLSWNQVPQLTGKLVIAQKGSLRYTDPARPETGVSQLLLAPALGRIKIVATDRDGSLYVGTGNTDPREEVGRDVLVRLAPAHPGASTPTPSPLLRR